VDLLGAFVKLGVIGSLASLRRRRDLAQGRGLGVCATPPPGEPRLPVRAPSLPYQPWQPRARLPQRWPIGSARNSAHDSLAWALKSTLAYHAASIS
jgi:hypothetical protein